MRENYAPVQLNMGTSQSKPSILVLPPSLMSFPCLLILHHLPIPTTMLIDLLKSQDLRRLMPGTWASNQNQGIMHHSEDILPLILLGNFYL